MQCHNRYVWRKLFVIRSQRDSESANSFSKLRDLAQKCENEKDLCNNCQKIWLRGQIVFGVSGNDVCQSIHFQSLFMKGNGSPKKKEVLQQNFRRPAASPSILFNLMTWSSSTSHHLEGHAEWSFLHLRIPAHLSTEYLLASTGTSLNISLYLTALQNQYLLQDRLLYHWGYFNASVQWHSSPGEPSLFTSRHARSASVTSGHLPSLTPPIPCVFHDICQQGGGGNGSDGLAPFLHPLADFYTRSCCGNWRSSSIETSRLPDHSCPQRRSLSIYDPSLPTSLHVDTSRLWGLGFLFRQQNVGNSWNVVQVGSCFLSDAENQYAMIDLECLVGAWVIRKCRPLLKGFPSFKLITWDSTCRGSANSSALSLVSLKTHVFGCQAGTTWWMVPLRSKRLRRPSVFLSPDQLSARNGRF